MVFQLPKVCLIDHFNKGITLHIGTADINKKYAFQNCVGKSPILKTGLPKNGLWVPVLLHYGVLQYETWHREHLIDDPVNNVGHKSHTILLNSRAEAILLLF